MKSKQSELVAALGPKVAAAFGGGSAGANVRFIQSLPPNQKVVARKAFADSLSSIWIIYVIFAGIGLAVSLLIAKNKLDKTHEETKTGLEAEKENRVLRDAERTEKKNKKATKGSLPLDTEAQINTPVVEGNKEVKV